MFFRAFRMRPRPKLSECSWPEVRVDVVLMRAPAYKSVSSVSRNALFSKCWFHIGDARSLLTAVDLI